MTTAPAIAATSVHKSYGKGATRAEILKGIDIVTHRGELTLLMGPSGSGKTTLMAILAGLARPDRGHVRLLGQPLTDLDEGALTAVRRHSCGFIFQSANLFGSLSAFDQVRLVLQLTGTPADEVDERAERALEEVGLWERKHLKPAAMSGGEQQRVAIARTLAKQPTLLFADEPTSALDRHNGDVVIGLLRRIAHRNDSAVLCVTHDARLLPYADRVIRIEDGSIVDDSRANVLPLHPGPREHENA